MDSSTDESKLGLYVHLPFCASRCGYCDFAVVTEKDDRQSAYTDRLLRELEYWSAERVGTVGTLYFGGGTPSRLAPEHWKRLCAAIEENLELLPNLEISAEANPDSLTTEVLDLWNELGINRISLGVQSFQPHYLDLLDRRHSSEQAVLAIENIRKAGFRNWSLDLIYGLPGQDPETWMRDLDTTLSFDPPHVSFYNLILHPNLPVTKAALRARREDEDEVHAELFLGAIRAFEARGYEVYELSNAARPGMRCLHNSLYWRGGEWIGLGNSASSYFRGSYFSNPASWDGYFERWEGRCPVVPFSPEPSRSDALLDTVMLRLRTMEGISEGELESLVGGPLSEGIARLKADLEGYGYIRPVFDRIALSPKGWLLHSEITNRLVAEIQK